MAVITITREFGCGGVNLAQQVARATGFHFAGKEVIGAVLAQYGVVEFDREYDSIPGFWASFDAQRLKRRDVMVDMLNRTILAIARHGNTVILGRAGFAVLSGYADVLNVRVQAPLAHRIRWVRGREKMAGLSEAEAAVGEGDKVRSSFIEEFYGVSWGSARDFDLVLDASKISGALMVATICEAAQALPRQKGTEERLASAIEVTPILASAVTSVLKCAADHGA